MGRMRANVGLLALVLLAGCASCLREYKLKRVIVLSRHGNRIPNPPTLGFCPNFVPTFNKFRGSYGQLTGVGMSELYQCGSYARSKYIENATLTDYKGEPFLPSIYLDNDQFFFQSENEDRNLMSTVAFGQGLFPDGTGPDGYLPNRPQLIPIDSVTPYHDDLFNSPRNGLCIGRTKIDKARANAYQQQHISTHQEELIKNVSRICGFDFFQAKSLYDGLYSTVDLVKIVDDALLFAETEGWKPELPDVFGLQQDAILEAYHKMAFNWMMYAFFGKEEQVTYWAGAFPWKLIEKISEDNWEEDRFNFYLNHRELLYAVLKFFQVPIALPGKRPGYLPTGSTLFWEVWQEIEFEPPIVDGKKKTDKPTTGTTQTQEATDAPKTVYGEPMVKLYIWWPTDIPIRDVSKPGTPLYAKKNILLEKGSHGNIQRVDPAICTEQPDYNPDIGCSLSMYKEAYKRQIDKTGTFRTLCTPFKIPLPPQVQAEEKADGDWPSALRRLRRMTLLQ